MADAEPMSETLRVGLLLETVQAQQRLAEEALEELRRHAQTLSAMVSTEVSRAVRESFDDLHAETEQTTAALQRLRRTTDFRLVAWSAGAMVLSAAMTVGAMHLLLPSSQRIHALRVRRAVLASDIRRLREYGGAVDLRRCGTRGRLCVRVDRDGPAYGTHGEFLLVKAP